jgi:hypothetical protein
MSSILVILSAILISSNYFNDSDGQRIGGHPPLGQTIEREGISLQFPSDWNEIETENENQLLRIASHDGSSTITIQRFLSGPLNEVLANRVNEFVYFGSTFSSIEVNSNTLRLSTIQSPYTIYSHSVVDNTAVLHYEKGYMSRGHISMITLNYDGIEESYYNNSGIADSIIGSMKIDPQALQ